MFVLALPNFLFCSLISKTFTVGTSPFLYLFNSSSPLFNKLNHYSVKMRQHHEYLQRLQIKSTHFYLQHWLQLLNPLDTSFQRFQMDFLLLICEILLLFSYLIDFSNYAIYFFTNFKIFLIETFSP